MATLKYIKDKYCLDAGINTALEFRERKSAAGQWVRGLMGDNFHYDILVFPKGSQHGINKGRISKLYIKDKKKNEVVADYERGWRVKPKSAEGQKILKQVLALYPGK